MTPAARGRLPWCGRDPSRAHRSRRRGSSRVGSSIVAVLVAVVVPRAAARAHRRRARRHGRAGGFVAGLWRAGRGATSTDRHADRRHRDRSAAASVALDRAAARRRRATPASTSSSSSPPRGCRAAPALAARARVDAGRRDRRASRSRATSPRRTSAACCSPSSPWFFVMRLLRELRIGRDRAEALVEELEASRAAQVQAAALAERGRLARDMHDVLAHSLSALALQLEGARLLARDRDTDPEVVAGDRARAPPRGRRARRGAAPRSARCAATRCPGPSAARARRRLRRPLRALTVTGEPRRARVRGAAGDLPHRPGGAHERRAATARPTASSCGSPTSPTGRRLTVEDTGAGVPVPAGPSRGGGYGITGMRERAELLGGRLRRRPGRRAASASSCGCRHDPRPARRRPARGPRGPRHAARPARRASSSSARRPTARRPSRSPRRHDPDVVLMDLRMPRCDGIEAIRRLAALGDRPRAIALTTYADDASVLGALRAGARGYLTKDAGAEDIRAAVEAVARGEAALDPERAAPRRGRARRGRAGGGRRGAPRRPHAARGRGARADRRGPHQRRDRRARSS